MGSESKKLHILFFPFMAHGHMIPMVDIAKLFASKNIKTTILTTPLNEPLVSRQVQNAKNSGSDINIHIIKFPTAESGSPEGCENLDFITSKNLGGEIVCNFLVAATLFQQPLEKVVREMNPDCLVADWMFSWATDSAAKFGIPRIVFHGPSYFSLCTILAVHQYKPQEKVSSDSEPFVIPNLPGDVKLSRNRLMKTEIQGGETNLMEKMLDSSIESELKSFGAVVNSFYELEPDYADHYRNVLGRRAWSIGPVSLCNRDVEEKARRGKEASIDEHECLKWLDSMKPDSVVYVCFGSTTNFKASQLKEIAVGLEASQKCFIWVVPTNIDDEDWLPEGFEERMEGKGMIIRRWAPQIVILEHEALGGFVTHCGWNSTLEGISSGVPMATWPVGGEQCYNEHLVTQVLNIGVPVGVEKVTVYGDQRMITKSECIEKAVNRIMEGEEAQEMRRKAHQLGKMARMAVEEGGSSYNDLNSLIDELIKLRS